VYKIKAKTIIRESHLKIMKKAIVLLMTIGFIALISALVLISLSISKKSFDQVVYLDARNQFSVAFKDFVKMLDEGSEKVNTKEELDIFAYLVLPPMIEPKTGVEFGFFVEPLMGKLNINYILEQMRLDENGSKLEYLERPLVNFFNKFELKEQRTLLNILRDTIDKDDIEMGAYSEIASLDFDFREGKIYSFNHLKKIFDHYNKISYDANVYKITKEIWEESFYFGDTNASKQFLDCAKMQGVVNLITDNLYLDANERDFCNEFNQTEEFDLKKLKEIYNIASFDKKREYLLKCNIIFNTENFKTNVTFDYDIKDARIGNIDKNFQE